MTVQYMTVLYMTIQYSTVQYMHKALNPPHSSNATYALTLTLALALVLVLLIPWSLYKPMHLLSLLYICRTPLKSTETKTLYLNPLITDRVTPHQAL